MTGATPRGPGDPSAFGPGFAAVACGPGLGAGAFVPGVGWTATWIWDGAPGVTTACGTGCALIGAAVASIADGCGAGVTGCGFAAWVGTGAGVRGADVTTAVGFGNGAVVGGALMLTAATRAGTEVGTAAAIGAGVTEICACVGSGLGAAELSGAGVGFGGPFGLFFASS